MQLISGSPMRTRTVPPGAREGVGETLANEERMLVFKSILHWITLHHLVVLDINFYSQWLEIVLIYGKGAVGDERTSTPPTSHEDQSPMVECTRHCLFSYHILSYDRLNSFTFAE
jgi:hypothetical protein